MKAKGLSNQHSGPEHSLLWYCFECLFHHKKFMEEQHGFWWGWSHGGSKKANTIDFFDGIEEFNEYMRSIEEDH